MNKFHHSEEVTWSKEMLDRLRELLLPAGHLGCALAAESVAVLSQAWKAMQLSSYTCS